MVITSGLNILHCAMSRSDKDAGIVTYISTQHPNLIHGVSNYGYTPLHLALDRKNFNNATAICQVDARVIMDIVIHTEPTLHSHLSILLQMMLERGGDFPPVSQEAFCLQLLIRYTCLYAYYAYIHTRIYICIYIYVCILFLYP
jgi:hypothetical protein